MISPRALYSILKKIWLKLRQYEPLLQAPVQSMSPAVTDWAESDGRDCPSPPEQASLIGQVVLKLLTGATPPEFLRSNDRRHFR